EVVARAVRLGEERSCDLSDLSLETLQGFSALVAQDVFAVLTIEGSLASRDGIGGTAPDRVRSAVQAARLSLKR
ncbi:MAG: argininosuccinate lyase, partial [Betaproteobacteria bacterium]|nr:argininosuccinate lyase [Betaproteobacteria bacterium]